MPQASRKLHLFPQRRRRVQLQNTKGRFALAKIPVREIEYRHRVLALKEGYTPE